MTVSSWPAKAARGPPVSTFRVRAVLSRLAVSSASSFAPKLARRLVPVQSHGQGPAHPVRVFQTRAVPSLPGGGEQAGEPAEGDVEDAAVVGAAEHVALPARAIPEDGVAIGGADGRDQSPFGLNAARSTRAGCGSLARSCPSRRIRLAPRRPATTKRLRPGPAAA